MIDIANVHVGRWSSSHSSVACSVVCRIANLLLLATGSASLYVWAGLVSSAWASLKIIMKSAQTKISNGCRDVQHTGLQSTRTRRNTGSGCMIIVGYTNHLACRW